MVLPGRSRTVSNRETEVVTAVSLGRVGEVWFNKFWAVRFPSVKIFPDGLVMFGFSQMFSLNISGLKFFDHLQPFLPGHPPRRDLATFEVQLFFHGAFRFEMKKLLQTCHIIISVYMSIMFVIVHFLISMEVFEDFLLSQTLSISTMLRVVAGIPMSGNRKNLGMTTASKSCPKAPVG